MTDMVTPEIIERASFILAMQRGWLDSATDAVLDASTKEVTSLVETLRALDQAMTEAGA